MKSLILITLATLSLNAFSSEKVSLLPGHTFVPTNIMNASYEKSTGNEKIVSVSVNYYNSCYASTEKEYRYHVAQKTNKVNVSLISLPENKVCPQNMRPVTKKISFTITAPDTHEIFVNGQQADLK